MRVLVRIFATEHSRLEDQSKLLWSYNRRKLDPQGQCAEECH